MSTTTTTSIKSLQQLAWNGYQRTLPYDLNQTMVGYDYMTGVAHEIRDTRPYPGDSNVIDEVELLEHMKEELHDTKMRLRARGRTGMKRNALVVKHEVDQDTKRLRIRVDDYNNQEFWFECEIPLSDLFE